MRGVFRGVVLGLFILIALVFGLGLVSASYGYGYDLNGNYWYPGFRFVGGYYSYPYYYDFYHPIYYAPVYYRPVYFPSYQTYSLGGRSFYYSSGHLGPYWRTWDDGGRCNIYWQDC